jgi:fumarate reductase flavoprotein subunit
MASTGNSVAETVVAGMIVGEYIADFCDGAENDIDISTHLVEDFLRREQLRMQRLVDGGGTEDAAAIKARMQEIMTSRVGIFRSGKDLDAAVAELQELLVRSRNIGLRCKSAGNNPELVTAYRVQKMLKLAICVAYGALERQESRGAHFRADFPHRDDAQWLKRTIASWPRESDTLPALAYEALDVTQMELPPGWRGYGAKDYIDHPDTPKRTQQIAAIRGEMTGRPRAVVQAALMPYTELLPARLRGANERIDEPLEVAA